MWRVVVFLVIMAIIALIGIVMIPAVAQHNYGPPAPGLSVTQVFQYSARVLWDDGLLTKPRDPRASEQKFTVQEGEPVESIADRLQQAGAIRDAGAFRDYLIYTGLDTSLQAGEYKVSAAMSVIEVAKEMQDATPSEITFVVWPGWRLEEIAESLPTSGLDIAPYDFAAAAMSTHPQYEFLAGKDTAEGFLYPDSYILPRTTSVGQLVDVLLRGFLQHLSTDLQEGFSRQGLSTYDAVTLASIVQREAVKADEAPMIASVYLNRLRSPMKLDADPTVQYAIGYNAIQRTWWTNPLGAADLQVVSPYNTYINDGLPPSPIANPGLTALRAVANPTQSDYYYFSARCDGSGYHEFARTFEEHLSHLCP